MTPVTVSSLGYELSYNVPTTADEFDQLAKSMGACVKEACNNIIYRVVLATFRDKFTNALAQATGIERKYHVTKPEVCNDKGEITQEEISVWDETEKVFTDRVWAELVRSEQYPTVEAAQAAFADLAQRILSSIVFDPAERERAPSGPKKTPKTYIEIADSLIEMAGDLNAAVAKFAQKTGISVPADRDALARAIWEDQKAKKKSIAAGYAG